MVTQLPHIVEAESSLICRSPSLRVKLLPARVPQTQIHVSTPLQSTRMLRREDVKGTRSISMKAKHYRGVMQKTGLGKREGFPVKGEPGTTQATSTIRTTIIY